MSAAIRRALLLLLLGSAIGTVLLAGCGGTEAPEPAAPPPASPGPSLPWPAADAAGVEQLQERVDAGSQPWLLDPAEVATSFGTAAYGWRDAHAVLPEGATDPAELPVELHGPGGEVARLVLAQPGRTGEGGIWVVTAARRA